MRLREATLADVDPLAALWVAAGLHTSVEPPGEEAGRVLRRDPALFLVVEDELTGILLGSAMGCYDGRRAWLYRVAVHPGARRHGVGRLLIEELERRLRELGVPKVNLLVHRDNHVACAFWEAVGYRPDPQVVMHGKVLR